jgi:collagenase-like PrtC family protease
MKYLVACNWDPALIDKIDYPEVACLFGGLPDAVIATGRPSTQIRPVADRDVKKYIARVHEKGWRFDYNANATCLANRELTRAGFKAIMKYLEKIADYGVDALTISNTNLVGIVKKNFPKLKVNLSTFQKVTEVGQARRYEDLGVDLIMLSEHVNRDFKVLRAIRKAVRCELALIANVGCIYDCPNSVTHANSVAHGGTKGETRLHADPFMLFCFYKRISSPEEVVKIRWIRPEDVAHYEDVGIDWLKIIERFTKTDVLAARVKAYSQRSYEGNLLEMLGQMVDVKTSVGRQKQMYLRRLLTRPGLSSLRAAKMAREFSILVSRPAYEIMYLDNKKLPNDFLQSFASRDCRATDCRACGNCAKIASQAVRVPDEQVRKSVHQRLGEALEDVKSGVSLY